MLPFGQGKEARTISSIFFLFFWRNRIVFRDLSYHGVSIESIHLWVRSNCVITFSPSFLILQTMDSVEAIEELAQLSDSMRQAAALLADEDIDETSTSGASSRRPSTFLNVVALGNVVSSHLFWFVIELHSVALASIYHLRMYSSSNSRKFHMKWQILSGLDPRNSETHDFFRNLRL